MEFGSRRFAQPDHHTNYNDDDDEDEDTSQYSTRSYIDIVRVKESSGTAYRDLIPSKSANKSRKSFNDPFRLSRNSSSSTTTRSSPPSSSAAIPASDISFGSRRFHPSAAFPGDDCVVDCDGEVCVRSSRLLSYPSRPPSGRVVVEDPDEQQQSSSSEDHDRMMMNSSSRGRFSRSSSVAVSRRRSSPEAEESEEEEEVVVVTRPPAAAPKVSLMDLLMEETGRQGAMDGFFFGIYGGGDDEEEEDEEEEEEEDEEDDGVEHECSGCMVRHRGAAFAPCGHTYCRLCSRELWASRGNCPLCNGYVMEILDIF